VKPWSTRAPDIEWDFVVIGSGMGGMAAAALLSEIGKRVLVLEQHYVPGGFTHTFRRPGYEWDVGVHAVGEVTEHSMAGRVLARLTHGELKWASLGPVYDEFHYPDGFRIDFPDSPQRFRANLVEAFPAEARSIDAYLAKIREVAAGMRGYYLARTLPPRLAGIGQRLIAGRTQGFFEQTTKEVIERLTADPRLRAVFAAQWGYYGSVPSRSSFAMQALVVKHFLYGGYYPVGGSKQIARTLLGTVAAAGGWTRIAADVAQIVVERGAARGVLLASGERIRAKHVISAAGVGSTLNRLLPEELRDAPWARPITGLRPASAHVCLYLGFKGDIRKTGAGSANKWFYDTWDTEHDVWRIDASDRRERAPILYSSFPSLKDPTHDPGPDLRHTGEVVTFVPYDFFTKWRDTRWKKRGAEYDALKKDLEERMLEHFFEHMPGLKPMLDYVELSTPLSTEKFCRPQRGSIYGLEPTPERFRTLALRPRSPIRSLFFAGSEVASVGVIGAMFGGLLAALSAEPRRVFSYLFEANR
jgi:all-trans-retinol 13,14-reductase